MTTSYETILVETHARVGVIRLNRPQRMNALNEALAGELASALATFDADDAISVVVITGNDKAFAAGADIGAMAAWDFQRVYADNYIMSWESVQHTRKPVIALIKGACVGGGLEVVSRCDMRICGQSARFCIPVNRLGLVVAYEEMRSLVDIAGPAAALEIVLEGRVFDAAEAFAKGLVNRVVADADVEKEVYATAARIAAAAPLVNRWHKKFVKRLLDPRPLTAAELEDNYACFGTEDFQIGYRAFLAKAKPQFKGR